MSDQEHTDPTSPTIILIGGPMTVDDGSSLDSRQPVAEDPTSHVTHASLATSLLWWLTASSLVGRLLDSAGESAFALLVGQRSVVELRHDGSLRRTGLRAVLPGGTTELELIRTSFDEPLPDSYTETHKLESWNGTAMGTVGFKTKAPSRRWRFLKGSEFYLDRAGARIGAAVLIDTSETLTQGGNLLPDRYADFEKRRLTGDNSVLVMPHTHRIESLVRGYLAWVRGGRTTAERISAPVTTWDPTAPPDPLHYTCPVPIEAQFGVTGLVQDGEWRDPSDLEAARALLQARYDLKIGIWDLVGNPTLRSALLSSAPQAPAPAKVAAIPAGAAERAQKRVAARTVERAEAERALDQIAASFGPLEALGWKRPAEGRGFMRLPLTDDYAHWPGDDPFPLVQLEFEISKRQSSVSAFTILYNQVDISQYVTARRETFESIAVPDRCPLGRSPRPVLWGALGGWADDVDWLQRTTALAEHTLRWRAALQELCSQCKHAHAKKFQRPQHPFHDSEPT
ncbi:hypothetical protein [Streptomyces geranii]|uniref:hypothetical protein n=1 Tax=Streptomyces geranii TaxID=2058923 RepID=UPI0013002040|nr:hypothetical protein [Streptomyces geranii]